MLSHHRKSLRLHIRSGVVDKKHSMELQYFIWIVAPSRRPSDEHAADYIPSFGKFQQVNEPRGTTAKVMIFGYPILQSASFTGLTSAKIHALSDGQVLIATTKNRPKNNIAPCKRKAAIGSLKRQSQSNKTAEPQADIKKNWRSLFIAAGLLY